MRPLLGLGLSIHPRDEEERDRKKRAKTQAGPAGASSSSSADDKKEDEDDEEEPTSEKIRGQQIYANPIFDAAAKYLLADEAIRLGFMRTFTGNSRIISTELLDGSLNPLRTLTEARDFLNDKKFIGFMDTVSGSFIKVKVKLDDDDEYEESPIGELFLKKLSTVYSDIKENFPPLERHSQLDVVCRLDNGEFILVEVQVKPQNFWDERALSYAAAFYGNQLKHGGQWGELKK